MAWRDFQQTVDTVTRCVVFTSRQLQAHACDFNRNLVVCSQFGRTLKMLIGTHFIAALLGGFCCQQIVHHGLLSMIGVFRH
ncbi:hypothetical protein D3C86_1823020 [compost metagenome]